MSTSLLYHRFGIRGYRYVRSLYSQEREVSSIANRPALGKRPGWLVLHFSGNRGQQYVVYNFSGPSVWLHGKVARGPPYTGSPDSAQLLKAGQPSLQCTTIERQGPVRDGFHFIIRNHILWSWSCFLGYARGE